MRAFASSCSSGRRPAAGRPSAPDASGRRDRPRAAVDRLREPVLASRPGRRHPAPPRPRAGRRPRDGHRRRADRARGQTRHADDDTGEDSMGDLGFWALAHEDPDHLALVAPDGTEYTAGELLGPDQPGGPRAARASDLQPGDVVATLLPNGVEMFELYLAALQAGWYLVPDQPPPGGARGRLHPEGLRGQGLRGPRALRRRRPATPPTRPSSPSSICFGGRRHPRLRLVRPACGTPSRPTDPADRTIGDVMNYTSGTTGNPKGVFRPLSGLSPEEAALGPVGHPLPVRHPAPGRQRPHRRLAALPHRRACASRARRSTSATPSCSWTSGCPRTCCGSSSSYRVTTSHMVPTQFHRLLALPEDVRNRYDLSSLRHMIHAAAPCPVDVKHKMIEWWGNAIDEYYAASEGGGTLVTTEEWLTKPGTVGQAVAHLGDRHLRRRRQPHRGAERDRHRLHVHADRRLRVPQGRGEDRRATASASSSPSATSASSTRTATCSSATARST